MKNWFLNLGFTNAACRALPRFTLVAVALCASSLPAAEPTATAATAINALGIDLLRRTGNHDANALISPYSIQSALAMTYAGADGVTRDEMARVLHYPEDEAEVHRSFAALRKALEEVQQWSARNSAAMKKYVATNDPFTLTVANRLFGQSGYDFRAPFLSLIKDSYDAPFESLDFEKETPAAARRINEWVEEQTRRRIRNIVPDGALDPSTKLVLVNAVFFKAPWSSEFPAAATKSRPFSIKGSQRVDVATMIRQHSFGYAKGDGFIVVAVPYNVWELRLLILLPDKVNGLAAMESRLTAKQLASYSSLGEREVILYLPKFKLEPPPLPLGKELKALGMKSAFDIPAGSANFDRIAPRQSSTEYLYCAEVFHKTFLKLDEQGTEAAAVTAMLTIPAGIHEPTEPVEVKVDHPFLFAIQHRSSGACLFLGRVTDPR